MSIMPDRTGLAQPSLLEVNILEPWLIGFIMIVYREVPHET